MPKLPALRKSLSLPAILASALLVSFSMGLAQAQQAPKENKGEQGAYYVQKGPQGGVGGYSLRLSDIWGPAKMPPAPMDFGPHFDFPPEPLNGAPLHDPYPN
jgi:hypothetical protein